MKPNSKTSVLERMLEPVSLCLDTVTAHKLDRIRADSKTQARVSELARKCNEGKLTSTERAEYEQYVAAGNMIAILKAHARARLTKTSSAGNH